MECWKRNLILVWLAQFLGLAGFWFAIPFIPYYIQTLGVSDTIQLNTWVAAFAIAGYTSIGISAPIWGVMADRYGRKSMLIRAHLCNAIILPLMGFAPNVAILVLLRFAMGMFSGSVSASQALISSTTPLEKRGFAIGTLSSAVYSGTMVGCFMGGTFADLLGYRMAFWICGFMFFIASIFIITGVKEDFQKKPSSSVAYKKKKGRFLGLDIRPLKLAWLIILLIMVMGIARKFDIPFFPLLVQDINGSITGAATWTGIIFGIVSSAGVISGPMLGLLADRISAPKVAMASALIAGVFMAVQGLAFTMPVLISTRFIMVFAAGGLDPVFQTWLAKSTPDKIRGIIFGWAQTANCIGWAVATVLCGSIATFVGLRWIYLVGGIIFLLLIPMIIYASKRLRGARNNTVNLNL
ncbi:MAG: MFS transporter [Victivallales bacterium]|nr:MFS transporter [Victivallales bacterium]